MNRIKLATGILLIFTLGVLIGVLGSGMYFKQRIEQFWDAGPQARRERLLKRLTHKLDLTPQQQEKVAAIFEEMSEQLSSLRAKHRPEFERIREQGQSRIKAFLTEKQKIQFDELMARLKKRHGKKIPFERHDSER